MNNIIDNNEDIVNNIREIYSIAPANKLRKLIENHFIPSIEEKKKNAEISTPVELVDEMLNKIPFDFWNSPKKVFEPCCGKGNFVLGIFDKFYEGLKEIIINEIERCKIIIRECIYYADISKLNIFITTELLKCHIQRYCGLDEFDFDFNNYTGDTLELNIEEKWGLDGFDAVIGNPPYQAPRKKENIKKGGGGDLLWNKFIVISLKYLLQNGYLSLVHPSGWRKPEDLNGKNNSKYKNLFNKMTKENQMIYLEIHNTKDGLKTFGCGTRYDWYLIEKNKKYKNTIIIDEEGIENEIDLQTIPFLPNKNIIEIMKMISCNSEENIEVLKPGGDPRGDYINNNYDDNNYKYTLIHSTPLSGVKYKYCNVIKKGDHIGVKKIIFGETGINKNIILDIEGIYGCTSSSYGLKINNIEDFENIKKTLLNEKFQLLIESCSWGNYRIDWRLFTHFKKDFWKEFIEEK
jgi:hypothetical protein